MRISLRVFLPLIIVIIVLMVGIVLVAGATYFEYQDAVERSVEQHTAQLEVTKNTLYNPDIYYHHASGDIPELPGLVVGEIAASESVAFVRILQPNTNEVIMSSDPSEIGMVFDDAPEFRDVPTVRQGRWNNEEVRDISLRAIGTENLWMGMRLGPIWDRTIERAYLTSFAMFFILLVFLFAIQYVIRKIAVDPVILLQNSLKSIGEGKLDTRLPEGPNNEIGDAFESFNETAEALKRSKERDELVAQMKTEFLSIAAHQLRTPLSAIKWTMRMLLDGDLGEITDQQRKFIDRTYQSNERMVGLINDLLNITRIEEGRFLYNPAFHKIEDLVESIVKDLHETASQKGVSLVYEKPINPLSEMFIDDEKLRLAISNLVDNAIRYTNSGGEVKVHTIQDDDAMRVEVQDSGIGIPEDQQARIGQKFFRSTNAKRIDTEGSGLGVYLVKNVVEAHGGTLTFRSQEGKGTTFIITIPFKKKVASEKEKFEQFLKEF